MTNVPYQLLCHHLPAAINKNFGEVLWPLTHRDEYILIHTLLEVLVTKEHYLCYFSQWCIWYKHPPVEPVPVEQKIKENTINIHKYQQKNQKQFEGNCYKKKFNIICVCHCIKFRAESKRTNIQKCQFGDQPTTKLEKLVYLSVMKANVISAFRIPQEHCFEIQFTENLTSQCVTDCILNREQQKASSRPLLLFFLSICHFQHTGN